MINLTQTIPTFHQASIDRHREKSNISRLVDGVRKQVNNICKIDRQSELRTILNNLFTHPFYGKVLREFFMRHNNVWFDLMRKMYKYREFSEGTWSISKKGIEKMKELILIKGRKKHTGEALLDAFNSHLVVNQEVIEYSSQQPSLLDSSGFSFSKLPLKERGPHLEKLIEIGLTNNIDGCNSNNREIYLARVYPKILKYLKLIFGQDMTSIPGLKGNYTSIASLAKDLNKLIQKGKYEQTWIIVQAFHAWSNVEEIEETYIYLKENSGKLKNKLLDSGINVQDFQESISSTGSPSYRGYFELDGKRFQIQWRIKTPASILQKMWHKQEYNNADALKDSIGMYIIYPDNLTDEQKLELLRRITSIMPDFGYVIKNKGGVDSGQLSKANTEGYFGENRPIGINEERGKSTSEEMNNFSVSGFISTKRDMPSGFEVQFLSENAYTFKQDEDALYKTRTAIDAFMRGPKYRLPSEIYNLITERCKGKDASETLWDLVESGYLIAYTATGGDELAFSSKNYSPIFEAIFPNMRPIAPGKDFSHLYEALREYIKNSWKVSQDVLFSNTETSSQPPLLDL